MNKLLLWLAAARAKFNKMISVDSVLPNVMTDEEANQTNTRLKAMQKHAEDAPQHQKQYEKLKSVASHTDLDSVGDYWFEKNTDNFGEQSKAGGAPKRQTQNRMMSQSKMTHTRLNAYIDTMKKANDNDIDRQDENSGHGAGGH